MRPQSLFLSIITEKSIIMGKFALMNAYTTSKQKKSPFFKRKGDLDYDFSFFMIFSMSSSSVNAATGRLFTNANVFLRPGPQYD
jgi:hypothetical protein